MLATFTVNTTADVDGTCDPTDPLGNIDCSVRSAIAAADANPGADRIEVPTGTYSPARGPWQITQPGDLEIVGLGGLRTDVSFDGLDASTLFDVLGPDSASTIRFENLEMVGGLATNSGGAAIVSDNAAIVLDNVSVTNHRTISSFSSGGAIDVAGSLTILNSNVSSNTSSVNGGAIAVSEAPDGSTTTVAIDNTLLSGNQTGDAASDIGLGGAIYVDGNILTTITDTTIELNDSGGSGGGVYIDGGSLTLSNNVAIDNNRANGSDSGGGGVYVFGSGANSSIVTIDGADFSFNEASEGGGGLELVNASGSIVGSSFNENSSQSLNPSFDEGGGAVAVLFASPDPDNVVSFSETTFFRNSGPSAGAVAGVNAELSFSGGSFVENNVSSTLGGGAIGVVTDTGTTPRTLSVTNVDFQTNSATSGEAGAIGAVDQNVVVTASRLDGNTAAGRAGGIGVIGINTTPSLIVERSSLSNNDAGFGASGSGGGIATVDAALFVENTTFFGNQANSGAGGGIAFDGITPGGTATIRFSTFSGNGADDGGALAVADGTMTLLANVFNGGSVADVGGGTITSLGANIDASPNTLLIGPGDQDETDPLLATALVGGPGTQTAIDRGTIAQALPLQNGSPAIDVATANLPATDIFNVTRPQGVAADAGAFEAEMVMPPPVAQEVELPGERFDLNLSNTSIVRGDFNGDGNLDVVAASPFSGFIRLAVGDGDGNLGATSDLFSGNQIVDLAVGDINGDGSPDVVAADFGTGSIVSLVNDGAGNFTSSFTDNGGINGVAVGDLNRDGRDDVVAVARGTGTATVYTTFADGSLFQQGQAAVELNSTSASNRSSASIADVTNDGINDVLVAIDSQVHLLVSDGLGGFADTSLVADEFGQVDQLAIDFDHDGLVDSVTLSTFGDVVVRRNLGGGRFAPGVSTPVGVRPSAMAASDLDGDCVVDLVVTLDGLGTVGNVPLNTVVVLRGSRDGTYTETARFLVGAEPEDLAIGDFDGDGLEDIVTANGETGDVSIVMGVGNAEFAAPDFDDAARKPEFVYSVDVDQDGNQDILSIARDRESVDVFLNNGQNEFRLSRTFLPIPQVGVSGDSGAIVGDFAGDGSPDVILLGSLGLSDVLLVGQGDGGFADPVTISLPAAATGPFAVADVDGDGDADVVVSNRGSETRTTLISDGVGGFTVGGNIDISGFGDLELADMNGDGNVDLVAFRRSGGLLSVAIGNGVGGFAAPIDTTISANSRNFDIGDINRDGTPDVVISNGSEASVSVFRGLGDGSFEAPQVLTSTFVSLDQISIGDYDGDSLPDIGVTGNFDIFNASAGFFRQFDGDNFEPLQSVGFVGLAIDALSDDFDGDGRDELVIADFEDNIVSVFTTNSTGPLTGQRSLTPRATFSVVRSSDLDGDGNIDLVVLDEATGTVQVRLGLGDGQFNPGQVVTVGIRPSSLRLVDVTGDGVLDIVTTDVGDDTIKIATGNGDGTFVAPATLTGVIDPTDVSAISLGGPGLDLVVVSETIASAFFFLNDGAGNYAPGPTVDLPNASSAVAVADVSGDGLEDFVVTAAVSPLFRVFTRDPLTGFQFAGEVNGIFPASRIEPADVNGDGNIDFVASGGIDGQETTNVLVGDGLGGFVSSPDFLPGSSSAEVVDFDADGDLDLLLASDDDYGVFFAANDGSGSFAEPRLFSVGREPAFVTAADVDSDGLLDAITANRGSSDLTILRRDIPDRVNSVVVDAVGDADDGDVSPGNVTLREATRLINAAALPGRITFAESVFGTITLGGSELEFNVPVSIVGPGSDLLTIDANDASRIFNLNRSVSDSDVHISGLTLTSGNAGGGDGGAIFADGFIEVFLCDVVIRDSSARNGGAIFGGSELEITDSLFEDNVATADGGSIFFETELDLLRSTVRTSQAGGDGGGIAATDAFGVRLQRSLLDSNIAGGNGGGLSAEGQTDVTILASTLGENRAAGAGGAAAIGSDDPLVISSFASIVDSTIAFNTSDTGTGDAIAVGASADDRITVTNSLFVENRDAGNVPNSTIAATGGGSGLLDTVGSTFNLFDDPASAGGLVDGTLGNIVGDGGTVIPSTTVISVSLSENGGETRSYALVNGSPAVDAGSSTRTFDQRGFARPGVTPTGRADIGAVESEQTGLVTLSIADVSITEGGPATIVVTLSSDIAGGPLSVNVTSTDVTATAGVDYVAVNETLTFSGVAGETQSFTLTTISDTDVEGDETLTLSIVSASDPDIDIRDTATVTIIDDDVEPPPQIDDATFDVTEDATRSITLATLVTSGTVDAFTITSTTNGTAVILNGTFLDFTPDPNFFGTASVVVTATGPGGSDSATLTLNVLSENDPPLALDDSFTVAVTGAFTIDAADLLLNDEAGPANEDPTLSVTAVSPTTASGSAVSLAGGLITITPPANFSVASDTFTYTVADSDGATDTATVTLAFANGLTGRVTCDLNGDGLVTDNEGAPAATVFIDENGNRALDAGEISVTTDSFGFYRIDTTAAVVDLVSITPSACRTVPDNPGIVRSTVEVRNLARGVAATDLDGDDDLDLVVAVDFDGTLLNVINENASLSLGSSTTIGGRPQSVIATPGLFAGAAAPAGTIAVATLDAGGFGGGVATNDSGFVPTGGFDGAVDLDFIDFAGDSSPEVVYVGFRSSEAVVIDSTSGQELGRFATGIDEAIAVASGFVGPSETEAIATGGQSFGGGGQISLLMMSDSGTARTLVAEAFDQVVDIAFADVDADGSDEIVALHRSGVVSVYATDGSRMDRVTVSGVVDRASAMAIGDFNSDGAVDVVVTSKDDEQIGIYVGNNTGSFTDVGLVENISTPVDLIAANLDDDFADEIVVVNLFGRNSALLPSSLTILQLDVSELPGTMVTADPVDFRFPRVDPIADLDVNGDQTVDTEDALRVVNELIRQRSANRGAAGEDILRGGTSPGVTLRNPSDTSGDGQVTPLDALLVINQLRRARMESTLLQIAQGESEDERRESVVDEVMRMF